MVFVRKNSDRKEIQFSEDTLIDIIYRNQRLMCTSFETLIPNCYTSHDNEADMFAIRRSGLCDEFEIKISRSDFLNDFKKAVDYRETETGEYWNWVEATSDLSTSEKSQLTEPWRKLKHDALRDGDMLCNYFWYVVKKGIITPDEVPEGFGLITVDEFGYVNVVRPASRLHRNKIDAKDELRMVKKLAYRFWDYRNGRR